MLYRIKNGEAADIKNAKCLADALGVPLRSILKERGPIYANFAVTYRLSTDLATNTLLMTQTTQYRPKNTGKMECSVRPSVIYDWSEINKYKEIDLQIFRGNALLHLQNGRLKPHPSQPWSWFQSDVELVLPSRGEKKSSYLVKTTEKFAAEKTDLNAVAGFVPLYNVSIECHSEHQAFRFHVGSSPFLIETVSGCQWRYSEPLTPSQVLWVRWWPN